MKTIGIILAAGQGTRMRSTLPKVLHPLLGQPMICYTLNAVEQVTADGEHPADGEQWDSRPVIIVGHGARTIQQALGDSVRYALQEPQLGTGHAVQQAERLLRGQSDMVLVIAADMPLLTVDTLSRLMKSQEAHSGPITMLTLQADDPRGFGRIVRGADGQVQSIVEEAQATPEQRAIRELNASAYCFDAEWLWNSLSKIPLSPKGEYYLTDLVGIAIAENKTVQAIQVEDLNETIGINTRVHLAEAEALLRQRINRQWMLAGVTIVDPATTYIEPDVIIGQDTVIWPNTYLQGRTIIGENCILGPNSIIRDTQVGNNCKVLASVLEKALLEEHVDIGPFGHLRKGAHLAQGVHMGNFGEVKNSYLGPGTKMGHFSYIGDATIGTDVNIGAGTITCNFGMDGKKNRTEIGPGAFIGSDTMLVAPVKVGDGAATGTGAVVTKDVPDYTLVVGVPARPIRKLEKRE